MLAGKLGCTLATDNYQGSHQAVFNADRGSYCRYSEAVYGRALLHAKMHQRNMAPWGQADCAFHEVAHDTHLSRIQNHPLREKGEACCQVA